MLLNLLIRIKLLRQMKKFLPSNLKKKLQSKSMNWQACFFQNSKQGGMWRMQIKWKSKATTILTVNLDPRSPKWATSQILFQVRPTLALPVVRAVPDPFLKRRSPHRSWARWSHLKMLGYCPTIIWSCVRKLMSFLESRRVRVIRNYFMHIKSMQL